MKKIIIKNISFKSFIFLSFLGGLLFGIVLFLLFFTSSVASESRLHLGFSEFSGPLATIFSAILLPLVTSVFSSIMGVIVYIPFIVVAGKSKLIKVEVETVDLSSH